MPQLLALNCGSSSFKFQLYTLPSLEVESEGQASAIGTEKASLDVAGSKHPVKGESHHDIFSDILQALGEQHDISVITHRSSVLSSILFASSLSYICDQSYTEQKRANLCSLQKITKKDCSSWSPSRALHRCTSRFDTCNSAPLLNSTSHHAVLVVKCLSALCLVGKANVSKAALELLPKAKNVLCFDTLVRLLTHLEPSAY